MVRDGLPISTHRIRITRQGPSPFLETRNPSITLPTHPPPSQKPPIPRPLNTQPLPPRPPSLPHTPLLARRLTPPQPNKPSHLPPLNPYPRLHPIHFPNIRQELGVPVHVRRVAVGPDRGRGGGRRMLVVVAR